MKPTATPPRPVRLGTGHATCHGAITVVNAIATGRGAAIGIDLATQAQVTLRPAQRHSFAVRIGDDEGEATLLAERCVRRVLDRIGVEDPVEATVSTRSTIPIARGLKSSSAAANAIVLATFAACGQTVGAGADDAATDLEAIGVGIDAALDAKVTVTGAFDDACAAYFGGLVATDNQDRTILHQEDVGDLEVLLVVPPGKIRTFDTMRNPTHPLRPIVSEAHALVLAGKWQQAMFRNSLAYGASYGLSNRMTVHMLDTGAIAAGISGTGPATAVVMRRDDWDCFVDIASTLAPDADILIAHTNRTKAHIHDGREALREPQVAHRAAKEAPA